MNPSLTCSFSVWLQLTAYFLNNWDNSGSPPRNKKIRGKETQFSVRVCLRRRVRLEVYYTGAAGTDY